MQPLFNYADVKFAESDAVFKRAIELFVKEKIIDYSELFDGYAATVIGTKPYHVELSRKRVDRADCNCYLGQNDQLCKHMLALGLYVLHKYSLIDANGNPVGADKLTSENARDNVTAALRKIRSYNGPSRIWFEYQRSLDIAAGTINDAVELFDISIDNAKYLWKLVLRLSKKLSHGGVDDSNGTIGGVIFTILEKVANMAHQDESIKCWVAAHCTDDTGFGFEEDLQKLVDPK